MRAFSIAEADGVTIGGACRPSDSADDRRVRLKESRAIVGLFVLYWPSRVQPFAPVWPCQPRHDRRRGAFFETFKLSGRIADARTRAALFYSGMQMGWDRSGRVLTIAALSAAERARRCRSEVAGESGEFSGDRRDTDVAARIGRLGASWRVGTSDGTM